MDREGEREVEIMVGDRELFMTGFFDEEIWQGLVKEMTEGYK